MPQSILLRIGIGAVQNYFCNFFGIVSSLFVCEFIKNRNRGCSKLFLQFFGIVSSLFVCEFVKVKEDKVLNIGTNSMGA